MTDLEILEIQRRVNQIRNRYKNEQIPKIQLGYDIGWAVRVIEDLLTERIESGKVPVRGNAKSKNATIRLDS